MSYQPYADHHITPRKVQLCECRACLAEELASHHDRFERAKAIAARGMILCSICGNKRCPHANDHRHACTGSNEAGQPGSAYPHPGSRYPAPDVESDGGEV